MAAKTTNPGTRLRWLTCAAVVVAFGCQSTGLNKPSGNIKQAAGQEPSSPIGNMNDMGVVRTDFKTEVPADERVNIHLDLGRAYESQGSVDAAIYEYSRALEAANHPTRSGAGHRPSSEQKALAHRRIAAALDRVGRFAQAESHYREALALAPKDPRVWNDAGYSAYLQQKWPVAEMRLKTAARLDPTSSRVHTNLGLCLAATGRKDEALDALTKAAGPAVAHANLGYLLAATGQVEDARKHYQTALTLQPALTAARDALAQLEKAPAPADTALAAAAPATTATPTAAPSSSTADPRVSLTTAPSAVPSRPYPVGVATTNYMPPAPAEPDAHQDSGQASHPPDKKRSFGDRFNWVRKRNN